MGALRTFTLANCIVPAAEGFVIRARMLELHKTELLLLRETLSRKLEGFPARSWPGRPDYG